MSKVQPLSNTEGVQQGYDIQCPACGYGHFFNVEQPGPAGQQWKFNGDHEKPTFSPSMLSRTGHYASGQSEEECRSCQERKAKGQKRYCQRCHSFVRDGKIQFLSDCTHDMAGQTVELPDIE